MIYDIVISDQAEIDLRGIFEYIAFELQAPENASGQFDRLEACIMDLDHILLYPTHYVKMCSRCSILLSHSLLESAHSFSSVSTSAFIGKFLL